MCVPPRTMTSWRMGKVQQAGDHMPELCVTGPEGEEQVLAERIGSAKPVERSGSGYAVQESLNFSKCPCMETAKAKDGAAALFREWEGDKGPGHSLRPSFSTHCRLWIHSCVAVGTQGCPCRVLEHKNTDGVI